ANVFSQTFLPPVFFSALKLRQPSVIESPRKRTSTSPFLAITTKPSCRFIQPLSGSPLLSRRGLGVAAAFFLSLKWAAVVRANRPTHMTAKGNSNLRRNMVGLLKEKNRG